RAADAAMRVLRLPAPRARRGSLPDDPSRGRAPPPPPPFLVAPVFAVPRCAAAAPPLRPQVPESPPQPGPAWIRWRRRTRRSAGSSYSARRRRGARGTDAAREPAPPRPTVRRSAPVRQRTGGNLRSAVARWDRLPPVQL